ncbi:MAG: hypothetical protein F9K19_13395 [Rhizobiaceae bacterium]|nr:MAG: hypothetical protein F9K19_13395 [Rhizobiaceae bacterium]CAG1010919.1 hypothetical protein RHIZO_03876 [Rhizobiaceae bacterium]
MTSRTVTPRQPRTDVSERRISAFIYGNVLVLAALITLSPDALQTMRGFVYVLGAGFSTYVAHVASHLFAHLLRHPDGTGLAARLPGELRDALPIATSALLPAAVLLTAYFGWSEPELCWATAIAVMLVRLALLGPVAAWVAREPFSLLPFLAGILLALLIAAIALLKVALTH